MNASEGNVGLARIDRRISASISSFWLNACGVIILLATVASLISFGLNQWPGLHWDAAFFAPPVINVGVHNQWSFGGYTGFLLGRESILFDIHGFLHVVLFAKMLGVKDWSDYFFWIGIYNALTILVYAFLFYRTLVRNGIPSLLLASILSFIPAVILLGLQGRPEHLVILLLALPFLIFELWRRLDLAMFAAYVCCALILIASPLVGFAAGVIVSAVLLVHASSITSRNWSLRQFGWFVLVGGAVAILITQLFTPFSFFSWIASVVGEGEGSRNIDFEGIVSSYFHKRYGNTMLIPAWNFLISLALLFILIVLIERQAFLSLFLVAATGLYFNKRMNDYGYVAFIPVLLYIAIDRLRFPLGAMLSKIRYRYLLFLLILVGIVYSYVFAQYALLSFVLRAEGHSVVASRSFMQRYVGAYGHGERPLSIGYPLRRAPSLVVLGNAGLHFAGFNRPSSATPASPDTDLVEYERRFNTMVEFYLLPLPPSPKVQDIPKVIYLGNRRYDFLASEASPLSGRLAGIAGFSRLLMAYHHAYHYAIYKASLPS
jgi:hypothetical protein